MNSHIALRIDDIGASSKQYEVYSKKFKGLGNILFLKYLKPFAAWGPYREMTKDEWLNVFSLLEKYNAKLTVGVTASWVNYDGTMTPFYEKFPQELEALKEGVERGVIEIASHGLTHCVLEGHKFRPRLFKSNRTFHREFWSWLPRSTHEIHLTKSKEILEKCFGGEVSLLIPPGNVYSDDTVEVAHNLGFKMINCNTKSSDFKGMKIRSNDNIIAFHDKEIVEEGVQWLEKILEINKNKEFIFVGELS